MDLVLRLRELRRTSGLTQKQAARLSGVGVKTISSFETGDRTDSMKVVQLQRLLEAYGVAEAAFFSDEPRGKSEASIRRLRDLEAELERLSEARGIVEGLAALDHDARRLLLDKFHLMIDTARDVYRLGSREQAYAREWEMLTSRN